MKRFLILLSIFYLCISCVSTDVDVTSGLAGVVVDSETKLPLPGCMITLSPTNNSQISDSNGFFSFETDMGEYVLTASLKGYKTYSHTYILNPLEFTNVSIRMVPSSQPMAVTEGVEELTDRSVTLNGIIQEDGGSVVYAAGFYYGDTRDVKQKIKGNLNENKITCKITGLNPLSKYYYKAYVITEQCELLGELMCFTTLDAKLWGVRTLSASDITSDSAILNAKMLNSDDIIDQCGFYVWTYGKYPDKYFAEYSASFSCQINNLESRQTYYYRAFIANDNNEVLGETLSFTAE